MLPSLNKKSSWFFKQFLLGLSGEGEVENNTQPHYVKKYFGKLRQVPQFFWQVRVIDKIGEGNIFILCSQNYNMVTHFFIFLPKGRTCLCKTTHCKQNHKFYWDVWKLQVRAYILQTESSLTVAGKQLHC